MGTKTCIPKISSWAAPHFVRTSAFSQGTQSTSTSGTESCFHSRLLAQQAKTDKRVTESEPQTTQSRELYVTEALEQKYGPTLGCERCHWGNNKSHDAACRQRMTSLLSRAEQSARETGSTCHTSCHGHWARTCEFAIGCGRHSRYNCCQPRSSERLGRSTTVTLEDNPQGEQACQDNWRGRKCACWMTIMTNGSMNLEKQMFEDHATLEKVMCHDRCENVHAAKDIHRMHK